MLSYYFKSGGDILRAFHLTCLFKALLYLSVVGQKNSYYLLIKVMNPKDNPNDKIYTPAFIVDEVMSVFGELIGESDQILEPFRGEGAFFDKLPQGRTDWCEIDQYRDFFDYNRKVDWIVTNPPYSTFKEYLIDSN